MTDAVRGACDDATVTKPAFFLDLLVVLVFAAAGRASHDLGGDVLGVLATAWPFLVGLAVGWVAVLRQPGRVSTGLDRPGRSHLWWLDGLVVAVSTLVVGMLLRSFSGGGTALLRVIPAVQKVYEALTGDEKLGAAIILRSLEEPIRHIAGNSGHDGGVTDEAAT